MSMSDLHISRSSTELQHVPLVENANAGVHIQAESTQQVYQANNDETRIDILPKVDSRCIYRVSPHLRANTKQQVYDPMVLSLGPYHHGKPQFRRMEEFKEEVLNWFVAESVARDQTKDKDFFRWQIMKNINILRENYEEVDEYSDVALVDIILRDACFLISLMNHKEDKIGEICERLGKTTGVLVIRDSNMLENQIPLWVIVYLLYLSYDKKDADELVSDIPTNDDGSQPLHILEAERLILLKGGAANEATLKTEPPLLAKRFKFKRFWKPCNSMSSGQLPIEDLNPPCHSVTYLQAKGIYFKPSSECLQDITFTSYHLYGVLHLPILVLDINTKVSFSNLVAFEMSPKDLTNGEIVSYLDFMKSLIDTSKDVKELRERGILYCRIRNDEEIVKVFKEIDTFGMNNCDTFVHVRMAINKHCHGKTKTWMADLFHMYFRSPWTIIAVFAATFGLWLTSLQTYYTIHPIN